MWIRTREVTPDQLFSEFVVVRSQLGTYEGSAGDDAQTGDQIRDPGVTQGDSPGERRLRGRIKGGIGVGHKAATTQFDANTVRPAGRGKGRLKACPTNPFFSSGRVRELHFFV
jgi:hypothetical protein